MRYKSLPAELRRRFGEDPFNVVLDCIGIQDIFVNSRHYLKPDGLYVAVGVKLTAWDVWGFLTCAKQMILNAVWPVSPWLGGTGRTWKAVSMTEPKKEEMERLVGLMADGKLKVHVDSVWEFEDALKGYEVLESNRARGKVIIKVDDEVD
jgi:NADPH:quinone reductase-like Zn-dependent oxidoreductase